VEGTSGHVPCHGSGEIAVYDLHHVITVCDDNRRQILREKTVLPTMFQCSASVLRLRPSTVKR